MGVRLGALLLLLVCAFPREGRATDLCDDACNLDDARGLAVCMPDDDSSRMPLPVMAFLPCNVPDFRGRGLSVVAQMAVEKILSNTTILPEYFFQLKVNVTEV